MTDKKLEDGGEYVLEGNSVWITVRNVSVLVSVSTSSTNSYLHCEVYPRNKKEGSCGDHLVAMLDEY